ncbi:malolactic enzyme [Fructobacillus parabroussonetiae]|uniref:malolactic enzyme n=1 Tax=Fructobacillus parabroussonetiae TaxID=2713174 RepID=UPI003241F322
MEKRSSSQMTTPIEILNNPFLNKGTGFTMEERKELGVAGLLPPRVQTLEEQEAQTYAQFQSKPSDLEKRLFLMGIFNTNHTLFYYMFSQHVVEFMPIVYDPVIADTIENYSDLFVDPQNAVYFSIDNDEDFETSLKNAANGRDIKLIVVTDAEGILGIGDWGVNGVDIAVGKLMVYTAAAGVNPADVLPVVLDNGTNNKELLENPNYLGNRHERVRGEKYDKFVDDFVQAAEKAFPNLYLHWEDFARQNGAKILNKYKNDITTFNDDIQGTGIITLAAALGAMNITGEKLSDQTYLSFGAGSAGSGIAARIYDEMLQEGLSEEEAKSHIFLVDKQGLLFDDMDDLTPEQAPFARKRSEFANADQLKDLMSVVKEIHPTILVGTSTVPGAFTKEIVQEMASHVERPIIFPLSNPTKLVEATAKDLLEWTDGKALVANGIPVDPIEYKGVTYNIGQANNALVYPGLGLGTIASTATVLNDEMISAAAHSLGGLVDGTKPGAAVLPPVSQLTKFSEDVAIAVAQSAVDQGITKEKISDVKAAIEALKWEPKY